MSDMWTKKAYEGMGPRDSGIGSRQMSFIEVFGRLRQLSAQHEANPQLIIVGDQSSGKSSLAEALTGYSFMTPLQSTTRFATEIHLHNTTEERPSIKVAIIPGEHSAMGFGNREFYEKFELLSNKCDFENHDLSAIVDTAAMYLSLPHSGTQEYELYGRHFSDDILKIEIWAPGVQSISIVDLPGVAHSSTLDQSPEEVELVKGLISEYMMNPQNVILAVMNATNNIANQEVFQVAKSADPEGFRTVGIITKCDAVQYGDENTVVKVARNQVEHIENGWFVVKNRSRRQIEDRVTIKQNHSKEEQFFTAKPWNTLRPDQIGIESLSTFLRGLLYDLVHQEFENLLHEVQELAEETELALGHPQSVAAPQSERGNPFSEIDWDEKGFAIDKDSHSEKGSHNEIEFPSEKGMKSRTKLTHQTELYGIPTSSSDDGETDDEDKDEAEDVDIESGKKKRPTMLWGPIMVGFTVALALFLEGLGFRTITNEIRTDGSYLRLFLILVAPLQFFISLFFCQTIVSNISQIFGPVSHMNTNSKYYSAKRVPRLKRKNGPLPHMTIQCPVYKEGLEGVIIPTVTSLNAAVADYEKRGGTVNLFFNDDGMQLISEEDQKQRRAYYVANRIGWVSRPKHVTNPAEGQLKFIRKGKFKKASNMNFALMISLKVEDRLLQVERHEFWTQREEEHAYKECLQAVLDGEEGRAWADGDIRVGDYILLIDSDTRVPVDCLIDAASEMEDSPKVGIIQFSSGVMQVTTSFFENGITWFTNLIYTSIRFAVSSGDVSAFVGHNAVLRWSALQETSFHDYDAGPNGNEKSYEKFWSESHVSEDFDMALRLQTNGYIVRMGAYTGDGFKEGVSLTVYDELARWEKYAYGCNELVFHPIKYWPRRGIFTPLFIKFIFSNMPLGSKFTILSYIGTYYAIGYTWIGALMNYFLVGWENGYLDHYYVDSFRTYFAIIVIFTASGNFALAIIRYRTEGKSLRKCLFENLRWIPLLSVFLGGLSMHCSQALLCHFFSIDMSWGATSKESEDTTFFVELPLILKRFRWTFLFCIACTVMMVCIACVVPPLWRINFFTAIWPLASVVGNSFLLPVLLNPALMLFTW